MARALGANRDESGLPGPTAGCMRMSSRAGRISWRWLAPGGHSKTTAAATGQRRRRLRAALRRRLQAQRRRHSRPCRDPLDSFEQSFHRGGLSVRRGESAPGAGGISLLRPGPRRARASHGGGIDSGGPGGEGVKERRAVNCSSGQRATNGTALARVRDRANTGSSVWRSKGPMAGLTEHRQPVAGRQRATVMQASPTKHGRALRFGAPRPACIPREPSPQRPPAPSKPAVLPRPYLRPGARTPLPLPPPCPPTPPARTLLDRSLLETRRPLPVFWSLHHRPWSLFCCHRQCPPEHAHTASPAATPVLVQDAGHGLFLGRQPTPSGFPQALVDPELPRQETVGLLV